MVLKRGIFNERERKRQKGERERRRKMKREKKMFRKSKREIETKIDELIKCICVAALPWHDPHQT